MHQERILPMRERDWGTDEIKSQRTGLKSRAKDQILVGFDTLLHFWRCILSSSVLSLAGSIFTQTDALTHWILAPHSALFLPVQDNYQFYLASFVDRVYRLTPVPITLHAWQCSADLNKTNNHISETNPSLNKLNTNSQQINLHFRAANIILTLTIWRFFRLFAQEPRHQLLKHLASTLTEKKEVFRLSSWYELRATKACRWSPDRISWEPANAKGPQRPWDPMAYRGRLLVLDFQLRHGGVPVEWRLGSHLLCGILLHGSCVTLLLPALVREYTSRVTPPWTPQDGSVAADDDAHRSLLIQGGSNHAFPGAGAGVEHGGHNSARWLLCLLPAPGRNQGIMRYNSSWSCYFNSLVKKGLTMHLYFKLEYPISYCLPDKTCSTIRYESETRLEPDCFCNTSNCINRIDYLDPSQD